MGLKNGVVCGYRNCEYSVKVQGEMKIGMGRSTLCFLSDSTQRGMSNCILHGTNFGFFVHMLVAYKYEGEIIHQPIKDDLIH
ncbi:unnamed protein product [Urochloa humidicola]